MCHRDGFCRIKLLDVRLCRQLILFFPRGTCRTHSTKNLERCSGNRVYNIYMEHRTDTVAKPVSTQIVLDADKTRATLRALHRFMSSTQIEKLKNKGELKFKHGDNLGIAVYYPKPEGNFIVIVMLTSTWVNICTGRWDIG